MLVNLLVTDHWVGRRNKERFVYNAAWEEIETAIQNLNGCDYTAVSIEKVADDSEQNEGDPSLSLGGGPSRFLITFSSSAGPELVAIGKDDAEIVELVIGGQSAAFSGQYCVSRSMALKVARQFSLNSVRSAEVGWASANDIEQ
jgi:hypothetical protein